MITIKDFDTRFPKLNESYFSLLSNEDKELYIKRVSIYHKASHFLNTGCFLPTFCTVTFAFCSRVRYTEITKRKEVLL